MMRLSAVFFDKTDDCIALIGAEIQSDEWFAYRGLNAKGYLHRMVEHGKDEYARDNVHVNGIEGWWSMLGKIIEITHVHV